MTERDGKREFDYLVRRAREERRIAVSCSDPSAALVHSKLAAEYERRAATKLLSTHEAARA